MKPQPAAHAGTKEARGGSPASHARPQDPRSRVSLIFQAGGDPDSGHTAPTLVWSAFNIKALEWQLQGPRS